MKKLLLGLLVVGAIIIFSTSTLKGADKAHKGTTIVLTRKNTLVLNTQVNSESVGRIIKEARVLDKQPKLTRNDAPIYLFLNTPGGEVETGIQMIDALNSLNRPIHTVTLFAASMGFQIVQGLGTRYITKHGELMSHRASGGFEGSFGGRSPSQVENRFKRIKTKLDEMDQQTADRTKGKQTLKSYQDAYADELWLSAKQAIAQGYADESVNVRCGDDFEGVEEHQAELLGIIIKYQTDACPINTGILGVSLSIQTNLGLMTVEQFNQMNGSYGADCLSLASVNPNKICAIDTSLTTEKVKQIKNEFTDQMNYNKNHVIPITY